MSFCTIASGPTLPHARVLADGLAAHHPSERLMVLLLGEAAGTRPDEPFEVLSAPELGAPTPDTLLEPYRWADLTLYLVPWLLRKLLDEGADTALYLDVRDCVVAPLDAVLETLRSHSAVLAPRV